MCAWSPHAPAYLITGYLIYLPDKIQVQPISGCTQHQYSLKRLILVLCVNFIMLITSAQQVNDLLNISECLQHVARQAVKHWSTTSGWDPGFWLRDGGVAHKCCLRVQAGCEVWWQSRGIGVGSGMIQYHPELSNVTRLARDLFNDQWAPVLCECSTK
jgi:hypothetical protein